jgi:hypothetical protein
MYWAPMLAASLLVTLLCPMRSVDMCILHTCIAPDYMKSNVSKIVQILTATMYSRNEPRRILSGPLLVEPHNVKPRPTSFSNTVLAAMSPKQKGSKEACSSIQDCNSRKISSPWAVNLFTMMIGERHHDFVFNHKQTHSCHHDEKCIKGMHRTAESRRREIISRSVTESLHSFSSQ